MRRLRPADYTAMPWRNGLGTTTEIFRRDCDDGSMLWRVSMAGVSADGDFSSFAGYDRHIMAIDGEGMVLDGGPSGPITVAPAFVPASFSGDWPIHARLLGGPLRDFNLISKRGAVQSALSCLSLDGTVRIETPVTERLIYVLSGQLRVGSVCLDTGEACLPDPRTGIDLTSTRPGTRLAICEIALTPDQ